ncbi:MAG: hypothetical protein M3O50_19415 [Myxococcota bacterium]|nr:hypothetical protein [Myxococcota bacterium]
MAPSADAPPETRAAVTSVARLSSMITEGSGVAPHRKRLAMAVAALADAVQLGLFNFFYCGALSPADDVLDGAVVLALVLILGFKWRLVAALALELVPGVALFPSWTAFVATVATAPTPSRPPRRPSSPPLGM